MYFAHYFNNNTRLTVTHSVANTINVFFYLNVFVLTQLKWLNFLGQNDSIVSLSAQRENSWVILTLKVESLAEPKFDLTI